MIKQDHSKSKNLSKDIKEKPIALVQIQPDKKSQNRTGKQSFSNRFKDKHSIISKEGLINLLQKRKNIENEESVKDKPNSFSTQPLRNKNNQKNLQQKKLSQLIKSRSLRKNSDSLNSKSIQLSQIPKKLPLLIKKSVSHTQSLHKNPAIVLPSHFNPTQNSLISSAPITINKISKSSRTQISKKLTLNHYSTNTSSNQSSNNLLDQLDKYALDHLNFLDQFQERIKFKVNNN